MAVAQARRPRVPSFRARDRALAGEHTAPPAPGWVGEELACYLDCVETVREVLHRDPEWAAEETEAPALHSPMSAGASDEKGA